MKKDDPKDNLKDALSSWEDYDESCSPEENLIELQVQMGFLDEAKRVIHNLCAS